MIGLCDALGIEAPFGKATARQLHRALSRSPRYMEYARSQIAGLADKQFVSGQYQNAKNLNARIQLHQRFSTNKYGWHRWVFDQFSFPPQSRILELGCGSGELWLESIDHVPAERGRKG